MSMNSTDELEILVTGGAGFLGSGIVQSLLDKHPRWHVSVLDLNPPPPATLEKLRRFLQADVTSAESVDKAFTGYKPDLVVHTAGIVPFRQLRYSTKAKDWEKVKAINYNGTRHMLDAAMVAGCRKMVYTSSCTVVIDDLDHDYYNMDESTPINKAYLHYGKSKGMAENYIMLQEHIDKGLKACALRPCTIIGPGDTAVISVLHDLIAKGETPFIIGDGDNFYDFMYIDNAIQAHVLAVENLVTSGTAAGHSFFISNQEPIYFWDFLAYVWAQFDHFPRFRIHIPATVAWFAGFAFEWLTWLTGRPSTIDRSSVKEAIRTHYSNNDKARSILGYQPTVGLAEGVRRSCDFYKSHIAEQISRTSP